MVEPEAARCVRVALVSLCSARKSSDVGLTVSGWSDGTHCRTFLAHYKRMHYLRACGVVPHDPGHHSVINK